jgi:hypothetical protein
MKKTFLALAAFAALALSANAVDWNTAVLEDGTLAITGAAAPASGAIEIPAEIGGKTVTEIADDAFLDWTAARSFALPETLRSIGSAAFGGCTGLSTLTIPASVTAIGDNAFAGCDNLVDLYFDGDCPKDGSEDAGLPEGCTIHVRSNAEGWGDIWSWCPVVRGTTPMTPLLIIENGVVTGCRDTATGAIAIPDADDGWPVSAIAANAFAGCGGITSVAVPASVQSVGAGAFSGCAALEVIDFAGDAPAITGGSAIGGDPAKTRVLFDAARSGWPESGSLFGGLPAYSREYPSDGYWEVRDNGDGTVTLVGMAYNGETELEIPQEIFGKPVAALGEGVFAACDHLEILSFPGDAPAVEGPLGLDGLQTVISVPAGSEGWDEGYGFWEGCLVVWGDYPESFWLVEAVAGGVAVTGTAKKASGRVDVPETIGGESVVAVGHDVFAGCDGLLSVSIPASVADLADGAFEGCTALDGVIFCGDAPAGAGEIALPDGAAAWVREDKAGWGVVPGTWRGAATENWPIELLFDWEETDGGVAIAGVVCEDMTAVTIPAEIDGYGIVAIGENAFAAAPGLRRVTFEGDRPALEGESTGLDPATCVVYARLPANGWPGVELAPEPSTWQGCRLEFCTHPETWWATEERGDGTLAITGLAPGAGPLEGEVILPGEIAGQKVTAVAPSALSGQTNVTAVWLHPNIGSIGAEAFSGTAIGSILLTSNVTDVAAGALAGCSNLTAVYVATAAPPAWLEDMGADPETCTVYAPYDEDGWGELPAEIAGYAVLPASHFETFWTTVDNPDGSVTITGTQAAADGVVIVPETIGGKPVTAIGGGAFALQDGLTAVVLPATIESLDPDAFALCPALTDVTFAGAAPTAPDSVGLDPDTCTVHAPKIADGWDHETGLWQGVRIDWYDVSFSTLEVFITSFVPSEGTPGAWDLTVEATSADFAVNMLAVPFADAVYVASAVADLPRSTTRARILATPVQETSRLTFTVANPDEAASTSFFCIRLRD